MPKISELTSVSSLTGTEELPVVQSTSTKKASVDDLLGYKVFSALITYNVLTSEFDNVIFKDTITGITIEKGQTSVVSIDSAGGLFDANKTMIFVSQNDNDGASGNGQFVYYTAYRNNTSTIILACRDVDVENQDVYVDDLFTKVGIEIRVYP